MITAESRTVGGLTDRWYTGQYALADQTLDQLANPADRIAASARNRMLDEPLRGKSAHVPRQYVSQVLVHRNPGSDNIASALIANIGAAPRLVVRKEKELAVGSATLRRRWVASRYDLPHRRPQPPGPCGKVVRLHPPAQHGTLYVAFRSFTPLSSATLTRRIRFR